LLAFGAVYWLSGRREALLAATGQAEVYRVTRVDGGCEIRFALGTAHGISPGAKIAIYDAAGQPVGTGTVEVCNQKVSVAQATSDQPIKVGDLVSRV
jgi:Fe2+ transport system protein FeoA